MFLNIIPKELESEIMKNDKFNNADHVELMRWACKRSLGLQQEHLAMITKRNLNAQMSKLGSISAMTPDYSSGEVQPAPEVSDDLSDAPPWVKYLSAAIAPPPSPSAAARPPRDVRGRPTDRRGASPGHSNTAETKAPPTTTITPWRRQVQTRWLGEQVLPLRIRVTGEKIVDAEDEAETRQAFPNSILPGQCDRPPLK